MSLVEKLSSKVNVVEGAGDCMTRLLVGVWFHTLDTIIGHFLGEVLLKIENIMLTCVIKKRHHQTYGVKFILHDIRSIRCGDGSEGVLDFLVALNVLGFFRYHEGDVFLQGHISIAVRIDNVEDFFELGVGLAFFHHWQVIPKCAQARLEFLLI